MTQLLTATSVQLQASVTATPPEILQRYRENRDWDLYQKEWIYRQFPAAGKTWLDLGCGTGEITTQLAALGAKRVFAVDVDEGLIAMTQRRAELDGVSQRVSCILGDITELDIPPVDAVLAYAVLHHVPDRLHEFSQAIARVLKPQGVFIFCEPLCYSPAIEWFRDHSGVARDALDPGERKLTGKDLRIIAANFAGMDAVHFHILGRWSRVVPRLDRQFRQVDRWLKLVPGSHLLAGSVIGVCRK